MQTTELLRQKMLSVFRFRSVLIALLIVFRLQSANLDVHDTAKHFAARVLITESALLKKETYFGYKVHALVTLEGYITAFEITPASTDDREGLRDLVDNCSNITILADKGYVGEKLMQEMQEQTICLFALKRSNSKEKLAKIGASADLQIEKTGRNCLFTVKRSVKCRKSTCQKAFRAYAPVWLIKYWHTTSALH